MQLKVKTHKLHKIYQKTYSVRLVIKLKLSPVGILSHCFRCLFVLRIGLSFGSITMLVCNTKYQFSRPVRRGEAKGAIAPPPSSSQGKIFGLKRGCFLGIEGCKNKNFLRLTANFWIFPEKSIF